MPGAEVANNHASREEGKPDDGEEENQIAQIENPLLKSFKMRIDTEGRDHLDYRIRGPTAKEIGDGWKTGEQKEQANHHRDDEANHLVARHC